LTSRSLAIGAACVIGGIVFFILTRLTPTLVRVYTERSALADVEVEAAPYVKYSGGIVQVVPIFRIHTPAELRGSDSDRLSISIRKVFFDQKGKWTDQPAKTDEPANFDTSEVERPFIANLTVADGLAVSPADRRIEMSFKDPGSLSESSLDWHWTVTAKSLGLHTILVKGLPLGEFRTEFESPPPTAKILSDGTLELKILALTALGLTAFWDVIVKTVPGFAGVLGVILAYPCFKQFFDALATKKTQRPKGGRGSSRRPRPGTQGRYK
jgi:hypothetical protein